jgi:hypothetical protein
MAFPMNAAPMRQAQSRPLGASGAPMMGTTGGFGGSPAPYMQSSWSPGMSTQGGGWGASFGGNNNWTPPAGLQQQISGIADTYTQNLTRNVLPSIRSNAVAMGGVGGSRQGIAEGIAMGDAAKGFANAANSALLQARDSDLNRSLQAYGIDSNQALGFLNSDRNFALGQGNLALGNRQADQSFALGLGGLNNQRYATDVGANTALGTANIAAETARRGQDIGLQGQMAGYDTQRYLGQLNADTSRYNTDATTALGYAGLGNARDIAGMQNATTQRGQDLSLQGQMAGFDTQRAIADLNNQTSRYGIDANTGLGYAGLNNQANIAGMQNTTTQRGQDLALQGQMAGFDTQRQIADMNNQTSRYGVDRNYDLGFLNNQYQNRALDVNSGLQNRNMDVTMRGQDIGWQRDVNQYNLGQQQLRDNFYNTQRGQDITQQGQGLNFYGGLLNSAMNAGAPQLDTSGFNWQGLFGGGLAGLQFGRNMGWY